MSNTISADFLSSLSTESPLGTEPWGSSGPLDSSGTSVLQGSSSTSDQQLLELLEQYFGGASSGGSLPGTGGVTGTQPGCGCGSSFGFGQKPESVKITSANGGEVDLLQKGRFLYNQDGKSVGEVNSDGSVTFNSGKDAAKDISALTVGSHPNSWLTYIHPKGGDGGNETFSSSQVTVGPGNLPPDQLGTSTPPTTGPIEVPLQANVSV
ncbi:hypothetical protein [Paraburkholderia sediminicola]|uniref:hypothetical protein n=1 Tax=Paraburkholderia sediminicola TaxID=458836 RepID=UPI0038BD78AA